jgi:hypothetical protein
MRCFLFFRHMTSAMLGLVLSFLLVIPSVQAEMKILPKDTKLHPQDGRLAI